MRYLIDTNIISEVMRKEPDPVVTDWFQQRDQVLISVITLDELIFGLRRRQASAKEAWLRQMLADVGTVLPVTEAAARRSGERRAMQEKQGKTVHQADALIAACAWEHGMILATRNTRDFEGYGIPLFNPFEYQKVLGSQPDSDASVARQAWRTAAARTARTPTPVPALPPIRSGPQGSEHSSAERKFAKQKKDKIKRQ